MSIRILWRSTVFILTLIFIYLAFPILIVPSSLPAIKAMFVEKSFPKDQTPFVPPPTDLPLADADAQIYELNIPAIPSTVDKINLLKDLHQQGISLIF